MEITTAASVLAVIISGGAASVSLRALAVNRRASQLPIIVHVLGKWREIEFMNHEEALWAEMPQHDASLGFQRLPQPMKDYAFDVCQYYQCLAYLSVHNIADYGVLAPQVRYRALRTWEAIRLHVAAERVIRGGENTFFNTLEVFIQGLERLDMKAIDEKARDRSLKWRSR